MMRRFGWEIHRISWRLLPLIGLILFLDGCTSSSIDAGDETLSSAATQTATHASADPQLSPAQPQAIPTSTSTEFEPMASPESLSYEPAMQPLVQIALDDLAQRLGIPTGEIEVLEAEGMVWGDTSMGCPNPDMAYLQVPQDGALIRLSAGGLVYNYHSGGNRQPFLCDQPPTNVKSPPTFGKDILTPPSQGDE